MIKFFRSLRRKLIESGSVQKYILYAFGEIFLVVIGILIALQINNWNERRKDRVKEIIILNDLADNLEINLQTFQNDIDILNQWNQSSKIVLFALQNKQRYSDTLRNHFHMSRITKQDLFISNLGYQAYKDQGLGLIINKKLSNEIVKLYEITFPSTLSTKGLVNELYPEWDNHIVQRFDFIQGVGLTPNDYESLFKDQFYISWLKAYAQGRLYLIESDQTLLKECQRVLNLIQLELEQK